MTKTLCVLGLSALLFTGLAGGSFAANESGDSQTVTGTHLANPQVARPATGGGRAAWAILPARLPCLRPAFRRAPTLRVRRRCRTAMKGVAVAPEALGVGQPADRQRDPLSGSRS